MRQLAGVVAAAYSLGCSTLTLPVTTETNWTEFVVLRPQSIPAVTECVSGRPVVYFSPTLPDSVYPQMWAHERVHVEYLTSRGESCESIRMRTIAAPDVLLMHEAGAYCAQARWIIAHKPNLDPLAGLISLASKVAEFYSGIEDPRWHVPMPVIAALFVRTCPEVLSP